MTRYKIINKRKRLMVQTADAFLAGLNILGCFRSKPGTPLTAEANRIRRILIIRLAYIGDVIMTLPVIEPLRKAFPNARIDLLTGRSVKDLLEGYPGLDQIIPFDAPWFYPGSKDHTDELVRRIKRESYDLGIDFRGDIRNIYHGLWRPGIPRRLSYTSGGGGRLLTHPVPWREWKHKVEFHLDILRGAGLRAPFSIPKLTPDNTLTLNIQKLLDGMIPPDDNRPLAVHPGSRLPLKRWPAERFAELIRRLKQEADGPVILLGHTSDRPVTRRIASAVPDIIDLSERLSLRELAALLSQCRLLICHDSAPMHIAAAVGTPVAALFGPSLPMETGPCGSKHTVIEGSCPLKEKCDENTCLDPPEGHCLTSVTVDTVLQRVLTALQTSD